MTRPALLRGLAREKAEHAVGLGHAARAGRQDDQHTGAERCADRSEGLGIDCPFPHPIGRDPAAEVATDQDRSRLSHGAARTRDDVTHSRVEGRLDDAGCSNRTADGEQCRARRPPGAGRPEPRGAAPCDQRRLREGFHVLHQRGESVHAMLKWTRRNHLRFREMSGDARDDCCLLPRDIAVRADQQLDEQTAVAVAPALCDRRGERCLHLAVRARGVDDGPARPDGLGGMLEAVEHEVGSKGQQRSILAARRFAFRRVRDDDPLGAVMRALTHGSPLDAGGKFRAATAAQAGLIEGADHRGRVDDGTRSECSEVGLEVLGNAVLRQQAMGRALRHHGCRHRVTVPWSRCRRCVRLQAGPQAFRRSSPNPAGEDRTPPTPRERRLPQC
jgi:hypothetical protein